MADKPTHAARSKVPAAHLGGKRSAPQPSIVFTDPARDERHVSAWTLAVLEALMARAKVTRIHITSTYRGPLDQARVMYGNLTPGKSMYAGDGRRVEQVAQNIVLVDKAVMAVAEGLSKMPGLTPTRYTPRSSHQIVSAMANEIERLEAQHGQGCVSRHQIDPARMNVLDISTRLLMPHSSLATFIAVLTASPRIERIGLPVGSTRTHRKQFVETQPCIHLEIPQPNDAPGLGGASHMA